MPKQREPIELLEAKGKKHLTKAEIAERRSSQVQPTTDSIEAPSFLTAALKRRFDKIAAQLTVIKIMGDTDVEALARYVVSQSQYEQATKELRSIRKEMPKRDEYDSKAEYFDAVEVWDGLVDRITRRQDTHFKQAQAAARELGLTISSRCRLQVPEKPEKPPNKFDKFLKGNKAVGAE